MDPIIWGRQTFYYMKIAIVLVILAKMLWRVNMLSSSYTLTVILAFPVLNNDTDQKIIETHVFGKTHTPRLLQLCCCAQETIEHVDPDHPWSHWHWLGPMHCPSSETFRDGRTRRLRTVGAFPAIWTLARLWESANSISRTFRNSVATDLRWVQKWFVENLSNLRVLPDIVNSWRNLTFNFGTPPIIGAVLEFCHLQN